MPDKEAFIETLETLFTEAQHEGVFSGAAAGYIFNEGNLKKKEFWSFGQIDREVKIEVTEHSLFDLASLTKPLVTVLSLLAIMEERGFTLQSPVKSLLLEKVSSHFENITVGQLMAHCSGLPAYRKYYKFLDNKYSFDENKRIIIDKILREDLEYIPGTKHIYSDLGYIFLGNVIEKLSQSTIDDYWQTNISNPLNLQKKLLFNPVNSKFDRNSIVATEKCAWSGKMLSGLVHDENCRVMGGVAGHAGLFGNIDGVLTLCDHLFHQFIGRERHPAYSNQRLKEIMTRCHNTTWRYGFDSPSKLGSSSGKYFSDQSVGHLGFTGTSFWIDLARGISVVLLTNRVHPTREDERIKQFRPQFHDLIMKHLLKK